MSDAGLIAIFGVPIISAAAGALFGSFARRRDDQARRTGERIGKLESEADYQRGRQAGIREARDRSGDGG